jgi:hypothetical protein
MRRITFCKFSVLDLFKRSTLVMLVVLVAIDTLAAQVCVAPPSGLVAWWPGDGNANDITGTSHGTLQNGATFAPGLIDQSFTLNSGGQYITVPDSPSLHLGINQTLDAWVFPTANPSGNYAPLLAKKEVGFPGIRPYGLWMSPSGAFLYQIIVGSTNCTQPGPGCCYLQAGTIPLNAWSHLAATFDGATQKLYINGALIGAGSCALVPPSTPDPLWIGYDLTHTQFFGKIDEVELFDRALSASEIQSLFNAGAAGKCKTNAHLYNVCPLYDPTKAVKSGSTIPIKFELCDSTGNSLSSSAITVHATSVALTSNSISGVVEDSGHANPDTDFRFDATLGATGGYIFNLRTSGLTTGTYNLNFTVTGDSFVYAASFQVK